VDGALQRVVLRGLAKTARIAALTDADSLDDQATIRLRIVRPDGGLDPNARTITVTVNDLYGGGNRPPTIVSAAWADPNPVTLPGTSTLQVAASDPDGDPLAYSWSKLSGPGTVSFNPNGTGAADSTTASFGAAGTYVLRVTVSDGQSGTATSDLSVVVNPSGSGADPRADCNKDGVVNALDLQIVVVNFGKTVE
jgi:hypothetical protein